MAVRLDILVEIKGRQTGTGDLATPEMPIDIVNLMQLMSGTADNQADAFFSDKRTLAASATENIDLAGTLTDVFGAVVTIAEVVAIYVKAAIGNTNSVVLGAASSTFVGPFGGTNPSISLAPGAAVLLANPKTGWAVAAGSTDLLKVTNSAGTTGVDYDIAIIGRSV